MSIDPKVLKQVRKALGLSQQQLADRLSLSRVTVNKMERGKLARGIPDAIGERLMKLKQDREPERTTVHEIKVGGYSTGHWYSKPADEHLWDNGDNGEDDQ